MEYVMTIFLILIFFGKYNCRYMVYKNELQ